MTIGLKISSQTPVSAIQAGHVRIRSPKKGVAGRTANRAGAAPMDLNGWLRLAAHSVAEWQASFPPFEPHPSLRISDEQFAAAFGIFAERMRGNYPYFHPSYAGQMLKPPHPAAVAGYLAAMLVNPNNQSIEAGKVTSELEKEIVAELARCSGSPPIWVT